MRNVTEAHVPGREREAARDLVRAHADCRAELVRAKQRLNHFLMRRGLVFDGRNDRGERKKNWTRDYWSWARGIDFEQEEDSDTFAFYVSGVRRAEATKKQLENFIRRSARKDRWRGRVEAAWHYSRASPDRKSGTDPEVPLRLENHAAKGTRRLVERRAVMAERKRPAVANCVTARELACWVWSIGRMTEGTM